MLYILPKEIITFIFENCDTYTQINTISTNKYAYNNYIIKNLLDRKNNYLTNFIIEQHKFRSLEKLKIKKYDDITQSCINKLNLIELYVIGNHSISNLCHMKNLKILYMKRETNISNDGICGLDHLTKLYISGKFTNL